MEVSPYFFLSYSRADHSPLVKRFFEDLSDTIRIESNLPRTQAVGFYEEAAYGLTSEWSDGARQALQDSGMMVSLLSPAYLHCERAGKEWQVFEMRRKAAFEKEPLEMLPESLAQIVLPVTWSQWHGPLPRVINETLAHPDHIHQRQAVTSMFRWSGMFGGEYAEFVKTLANQIIEMTPATSRIRPLEPFPKMSEVHSAFYFWDQTSTGSNEFGKESRRNGDASRSHPQEPAASTSHGNAQTGPYSVFAISKEEEILERIKQCSRSSLFKLKNYKNPDKAGQDIETLLDDGEEPPDLVIVDLNLEQREIEITRRLSEKMKLSSEIILLSGRFEQRSLQQFGGHTIVQKSDLEDELFDLMRKCARIGRDRSDFCKNRAKDLNRSVRPVFLSYCHRDRIPASFLLRNFEARDISAWSMDETLKPGDDSYSEIVKGLDDARILVSLISKDYLQSAFCKGELFSFYTRVKRAQCEEGRPHLISVLYEKPDVSEYDFIIKPYQYIEMSDKEYLIELQTLIRRIHNLLQLR